MTTPLERSDRYLREFVEALNLCPWAKRCRETGRLHRRVLAQHEAAGAIAAVEALPAESVEVALLIFPDAPAATPDDARTFQQFAASVRDQMFARHAGEPPFYCVAFHPHLPLDVTDPHRAVQFIRRAPDPTLQLVRASLLRAVRQNERSGSRFLDAETAAGLTLEQLLAVASPLSVSDRIAEANLAAVRGAGVAQVEALLASLRPAT